MLRKLQYQPTIQSYSTEDLLALKQRKQERPSAWLPFKWEDITTELKRREHEKAA